MFGDVIKAKCNNTDFSSGRKKTFRKEKSQNKEAKAAPHDNKKQPTFWVLREFQRLSFVPIKLANSALHGMTRTKRLLMEEN